MQKLIVFNHMSLDGYFVDRNGEMSWAQAHHKDAEWNAFVEGNASGTASLVINFSLPGASFCGAHSLPFTFAAGEMTSYIGVSFKAGGAFPFLPLPADELPNQIVPLDTLWGCLLYTSPSPRD